MGRGEKFWVENGGCYKNNNYICMIESQNRRDNESLKTDTTMNIPSNLKYSNDHEWCRVEGEFAYVGITDFAQSQLGDIVFVDVPTVGEELAAGEIFGSIEAVKTVSDAFIPVSGEVVEFNDAVDADPALVNKDPYGEGWMIKVRLTAPEEVDGLLTDEQYKELIG